MNNRNSLLSFNLIISVSVLMCACVRPPEQPRVEQPSAPEAVPPQATATSENEDREKALKLPPPSASDVRNAITRMYKNAVIVDASRFMAGDFNGDGDQDVAVVVMPAEGMIAELNSEVANWILGEPKNVVLPDPNKRTQILGHSQPTRVEQSDTLLAVLHGYGAAGWRDPRARQTYLLRNAVGTNMKTQQLTNGLQMVNGKKSVPKLRGDVISEAIAGEQGLLYYTGAKYAWYRTSVADKTVASRR